MGGKDFFRSWRSPRTQKDSSEPTPSTVLGAPDSPSTAPQQAVAAVTITSPPLELEHTGLIHLNKDTPIPDTYSEGTFPIDIIAVHGLNGGPYSTWTHSNGTFWLRDLLTKELPGARVYSFGYEAKVFLSLGTGGFEDFARQLLEDIRSERGTPALQRRPIVFVCHSMGGIIVKKALNITTVDHARFSPIIKATVGILFMATPHGGSAAASTGAIVAKMSNVPFLGRMQVSNANLVTSLKLDSKELQNIARDFRHLTKDINIYSFIEQMKIVGIGIIVDQKSGSMNVDKEVVIPMGGYDHRSICRFEAGNSVGYKRVLAVLKEVAVEVTIKVHAELFEEDWPCLQSLSFPGIQYKATAHSKHPNSCNWLPDHPTYRSFLSSISDCPMLLLTGHPGSGKSTLMTFLFTAYARLPSHAQGICLGFFFNGNGNMMQRSKLGMSKALLWHLYQQSVDARNMILAKWKKKQAGLGSKWEWLVDETCELLIEVLCRQQREVLVFVDAVDEAVDTSGTKSGTDILAYLRLLNVRVQDSGGRVKICASCRHYPVFTSGPNTVEIVAEECNTLDLTMFVRSQLQGGVKDWDRFPQNERRGLENAIVRIAAGVFLWAELRLRKIVKNLNDGVCEIGDLTELIDTESNELFIIYQRILENDVDGALKEKAVLFMQWVSLAERPLTLEELRVAMACDGLPEDGLTNCEELKGFVQSDERMERLVRSLSGGLAVLTASGGRNDTVQLFHATVYDYLRDRGLNMLLASLDSSVSLDDGTNTVGISQVRLSRSCLLYLSMEDLLAMASIDVEGALKRYRFLEYATRYWLGHAERAESLGLAQAGILDILGSQPRMCEIWRMIYFTIARYEAKCPERQVFAPIHVGSLWNLQSMVRLLLRNGVLVDEADDAGNTALHHSCRLGHCQLVTMLLASGANIEAQNLERATPLELAADNGHDEIIRLLLKHGADLHERACPGGNALHLAAGKGSLSTVKILFTAGLNLDIVGGPQGNALKAAAYAQHLEIVEFLLRHNADVNQEGGYHGTALHAAVAGRRGEKRAAIVHLLLQAGANPNIQGCELGNAVQAAAVRGSLNLVRTLMEYSADINVSEGELGSPLQAACMSHCDELVTFLLEQGADINAVGGEYGTALQATASGGRVELVQFLLNRGADVNLQGGRYGTALQAGAASPIPEVVQVLLDAGADPEIKGGYYGNLLQAAAHAGHLELAKSIMRRGGDLNEQGGHFNSVLQAAIVQCPPTFIEFLLHSGANPNSTGGEYGSPLQAAVVLQKEAILRLLLDSGADINAVASDGTFALQTAARGGHIGIVTTLLNSGAEVNLYRGGWRSTALHEAVNADEKATVELLLKRGALVEISAGFFNNAFEAGMMSMNMTNFLLDKTKSLGGNQVPIGTITETVHVEAEENDGVFEV